jgi:hypothetical protein
MYIQKQTQCGGGTVSLSLSLSLSHSTWMGFCCLMGQLQFVSLVFVVAILIPQFSNGTVFVWGSVV